MQLPAWPNTASPFFHQKNTPKSNRDPFPTPSKPQNDPERVTGRSKNPKMAPGRVSGRSKMGPRELPKHPRRPSWTHPGIQDGPRTAGRAIHAARAGPNRGFADVWGRFCAPAPRPGKPISIPYKVSSSLNHPFPSKPHTPVNGDPPPSLPAAHRHPKRTTTDDHQPNALNYVAIGSPQLST